MPLSLCGIAMLLTMNCSWASLWVSGGRANGARTGSLPPSDSCPHTHTRYRLTDLFHNLSIRPYLDTKTASTIATSTVHSKLDYCNSLYHNLPKCQITRLQQIQNSLARAVVKAPKSSYITPILRSLHWLKITERTEYKLLSLTYKVLTTTQPSYLHNLITVQPPRSTRSSP